MFWQTRSWHPFHKQLISSQPKSYKNTCTFISKIMIRSSHNFCTCHDSLAVVACAKFWPDWIIRIKTPLRIILIIYQACAPKPFVKWVNIMMWAWLWRPHIVQPGYKVAPLSTYNSPWQHCMLGSKNKQRHQGIQRKKKYDKFCHNNTVYDIFVISQMPSGLDISHCIAQG